MPQNSIKEIQTLSHSVSYDTYSFSPNDNKVTYNYSVRNCTGDVLEHFITELHIPFNSVITLNSAEEFALASFGVCHIAYIYLPFAAKVKTIEIRALYLTSDQLTFFEALFKGSLAEYYFLANLDLTDSFKFICLAAKTSYKSEPLNMDSSKIKVLVPEGGGKDSTLVIELLHSLGSETQWMYFGEYVGQFQHYRKLAALAEASPCKTVLVAEQNICDEKRLQDLNLLPDLNFMDFVVYSSLHIFASAFLCLRYKFEYICVGNEHCANFNHVTHPTFGYDVNHQYEKSFQCESAFHHFIKRYISPDIHYFSGLQHMYEIDIAERFCKMPQYFDKILSCNCALDDSWCCSCEKCAFVYMLFVAFLPVSTVMEEVFGKLEDMPKAIESVEDMFDSIEHQDLFEALMGLKGFRPLECVGTPDEVLATLFLSYQRHYSALDMNALPLLFKKHKDLILHKGRKHLTDILKFQQDCKEPSTLVPNLYPSWYTVR